MGLHIAIGFAGQEASAACFPVYVGRSKSEMLAAMEGSNAVRFEVISNQTGVRKNNPRHDSTKAATVLLPMLATVSALVALRNAESVVKSADEVLKGAVAATESAKGSVAGMAADLPEEEKVQVHEALKVAEERHGAAVKAYNVAVEVLKAAKGTAEELVRADKARGVKKEMF
jgi:hypothetical protein